MDLSAALAKQTSDRAQGEDPCGTPERLRLRIGGQVQGVGFRPFVHRLATDLALDGWVLNDVRGVLLEVRGTVLKLDRFRERIVSDSPPLARIDSLAIVEDDEEFPISCAPPPGFRILESATTSLPRGRVTVDSAVCVDCLAEMNDPLDRRFGYGLINCTNCGPRYSLIRDLPYDRSHTTMAGFDMCPDCAAEYSDPTNRRFHAQPTGCVNCGPRISLLDTNGDEVCVENPTRSAAGLLRAGKIIAMKGLGGYHLVVVATDSRAVRRLRERKRRDRKPFAIIVTDLAMAQRLCRMSRSEVALLQSPVSPVVIATERGLSSETGEWIAPEVAPGQHTLGVMLPNTPMQHLLAREIPMPLVMTSANVSDDPLIKDDVEVVREFGGVVDGFLIHDRPIERSVDDSVFTTAVEIGEPLVVRRARGLAPEPVVLPIPAPSEGLCCGADLKNSITLVRHETATLSQYVGDLTHSRAYDRFLSTIEDMERLLDVKPEWLAVDLHPSYLSRRYGNSRRTGGETSPRIIGVQHHHAHMASLMVEHSVADPIVGLVCDGVGYGFNGTAWGGEVLVGDLETFTRYGHIRPLRLPGGDAAAKQVGRCALSWLADSLGFEAALSHPLASRAVSAGVERTAIFAMLRSDLHCPSSTGMGRLFDATASLLGLCSFNHYEAMSGQMLESIASTSAEHPAGDGIIPLTITDHVELDTRPLARTLVAEIERGVTVGALAWLFHDAVADGLVRAAIEAAEKNGLDTVGLTGGVFCNLLLTALVRDRLERKKLKVLLHRRIPPNDGGISIGQAAVAAATLAAEKTKPCV